MSKIFIIDSLQFSNIVGLTRFTDWYWNIVIATTNQGKGQNQGFWQQIGTFHSLLWQVRTRFGRFPHQAHKGTKGPMQKQFALALIVFILSSCAGGGSDDESPETSSVAYVAGPYSGNMSVSSNSCDGTRVIPFEWTVNQTIEQIDLNSGATVFAGDMTSSDSFSVTNYSTQASCTLKVTIEMTTISSSSAQVRTDFAYYDCADGSPCNATFRGVAFRRTGASNSGSSGSGTATATPTAQPQSPPQSGGGGGQCCKICSVGIPCGNTCIAASKTCHVGQGCAC
jgi:hypothetical protein